MTFPHLSLCFPVILIRTVGQLEQEGFTACLFGANYWYGFSSSFLIHLEDSLRVLLVFQPDSVFTQYVAKYLLKSRLGEQSKITSATSVDEMKALWEGMMFELSLS